MKIWKPAKSLLALMMILIGLIPGTRGSAYYPPLQDNPLAKAQAIVRNMTPEERVGQLFLVTFHGRQVDTTSQIYNLITQYHIGGVVLKAANDNFIGPDQAVASAAQLITQLQTTEWGASQTTTVEPSSGGKVFTPIYIPLFIGIDQEGDGYPTDQILNGLTPIPDLMALGATWKPDMATRVGNVIGKELAALGINLYMGLNLDVLAGADNPNDAFLGTRTFSGSPYWVGEMGKALISGIHEGANSRMAVISKHFPGVGASDRPPQEEVATVRKTLDQLKQQDLIPFFDVTGDLTSPAPMTDGLLVSHTRYQGFQGNVPNPKPVSFDVQALNQLLSLPPMADWRAAGGLLVSDDLGSRAVRRMVDPSMQNFDSRQVARDAFLAGNDLLFADNFMAAGDPDSYTSLVRTLDFFSQKYREDSVFQQRVDESVTRILALKLRMYATFDLSQVVPGEAALKAIGSQDSSNAILDVARQAVTLITPALNDLDTALPQSPSTRERMIFITDSLTARQCSTCPDQNFPAVDALQNAVIRLYGPTSGGRINTYLLSSFSFDDLDRYMNNETGLSQLQDDLNSADWVVFSMLDSDANRPASNVVHRFLDERPDLIRNKKVIAFAFNVPNYLDATDISKLTAYYGLYSKIPAFQDVAARVLFQEIIPAGQLPISVPGAGYDLPTALSPDPDQVISLTVDIPEGPPLAGGVTPTPPPAITFKVGDTIPLHTGIIRDHNHNQVPDGTPVRFIFTRTGDTPSIQQIDTVTGQGIARAEFRIDGPGLLEIRVEASPARTSDLIRLDVTRGESAGITAIAPPTATPTTTPTPTYTPSPTPTSEPLPAQVETSYPRFQDWFLALIIALAGGVGVYFAGIRWGTIRWALRWGLCAVLGGIAAFTYIAIGLPGGRGWAQNSKESGILGLTVLGVVIGWACGIAWRVWLEQKPFSTSSKSR